LNAPEQKHKALEKVQNILDSYINQSQHIIKNASHAYGVAHCAALLAKRRNLDPYLCAAAGLLHDIYFIVHATYEDHDILGAKLAYSILQDTDMYAENDIHLITQAIARHDLRDKVHEPYDEVLKDADIIFPYFKDLPETVNPSVSERVHRILQELHCSGDNTL